MAYALRRLQVEHKPRANAVDDAAVRYAALLHLKRQLKDFQPRSGLQAELHLQLIAARQDHHFIKNIQQILLF